MSYCGRWRRVLGASSVGVAVSAACVDLAGVEPWPDAASSASASSGGAQDAGGDATEDGGAPGADASGLYYEAVMDSGPLAFWRFDEMPVTTVAKNEIGADTAEYVGSVTLGVPGAVPGSTAVALDGGGYISTALDEPVDFSDNAHFSLEVWIRPQFVDDVYRHVLSKKTSNPGANGYAIYTRGIEAGVSLGFELYGQDGEFLCGVGYDDVLDTKNMNHIVATYDGVTARLYVNGQLDMDNCNAPGMPGNDLTFAIAHNADTTGIRYSGVIDEVAIFPRVLSGDEVAAHYKAAAPPQ